jgi:hypothetical protein
MNPYLRRFIVRTRQKVPFIDFSKEFPRILCTNRVKSFIRPFVFVNQHKYKYCRRAFRNVKTFHFGSIKDVALLLKQKLFSMMELKKTAYCAVCDAKTHNNYDFTKKTLTFTQDFCHDILTEYKDLVIFKNVLMVEYLNSLLQITECIESDGHDLGFPYQNIITWQKRRITFIQRCYRNINGSGFYKYCRFMCVQF